MAGKLITLGSEGLKDVRHLEVAQDGEFRTVWFTNRQEELGYIRTHNSEFSSGHSALILPAKKASSFACVAQPSQSNGNVAWQMLMSLDRQGNLTLLRQANDTGIWKSEPFYVPSNTENFEVESYTITINTRKEDGMLVASGRAFIATASAVEAKLNGLSCTLTPDGGWYDIDDSGSLDFIIPTQSLGAQSLTISKLVDGDGKAIDTKPVVHDPSAKPMQKMHEKLASFKDSKALAQAKTGTGASLFASAPDMKELDGALTCFKTLGQAYTKLPSDGTSALAKGFKRADAIAEVTAVETTELAMDGWEWIKKKAHDAVEWVVEAVGEQS